MTGDRNICWYASLPVHGNKCPVLPLKSLWIGSCTCCAAQDLNLHQEMRVGSALTMTAVLCCLQCCLLDHSRQLPLCNDGSNEEVCSWSDVSAEQKPPSFSFNQCVYVAPHAQPPPQSLSLCLRLLCSGLNYDFDSFIEQEFFVHYATRNLNPVRFSRNRVCALHNVIPCVLAINHPPCLRLNPDPEPRSA